MFNEVGANLIQAWVETTELWLFCLQHQFVWMMHHCPVWSALQFFRHFHVDASTWWVNRHLHVMQTYYLCRGKYFLKKLNPCSFISHFLICDSSFTPSSSVQLQCNYQYQIWKLWQEENGLDNFLEENSLQNASLHANAILLAMTSCIIKNTGLQVSTTGASLSHPWSVTWNNQLFWLSQMGTSVHQVQPPK